MRIDTTALLQGVSDAYDQQEISYGLFSNICNRIESISSPGDSGRKECDYDDLFVQMGLVPYDCTISPEPTPFDFARLWRRLGVSLADGISVAD